MIRVLDKYFFAGYDLGIWMRRNKIIFEQNYQSEFLELVTGPCIGD
jgi:hypothetical protein